MPTPFIRRLGAPSWADFRDAGLFEDRLERGEVRAPQRAPALDPAAPELVAEILAPRGEGDVPPALALAPGSAVDAFREGVDRGAARRGLVQGPVAAAT